MTLEEFGSKLGDLIIAKSPEKYSKAVLKRVLKNNSCEEYHLAIHTAGVSISPSIDIKPYYEAVESGGYLIERVADSLYERLMNYQSNDVDVDRFMDFNWVKENIYLKLINYEANKELLEEVVHIKFLDLAIIFYVELIIEETGVGTVTINNNHLAIWGTAVEELYDFALRNSQLNKPAKVYRLSDFNPDLEVHDSDMIFLTNSDAVNGATVMLYDNVFDDNVYVIPSSIHECVVIPVNDIIGIDELKAMIRVVNLHEVKPQEVLSNNLYLYKDGKLNIV